MSPIRTPDSSASRSTPSLQLEQLKSFLIFLSDLDTLVTSPPELIDQKVTALFRYVESNAPLTFALSRFRLVQQFDGLLIIVSALSCLSALGPAYEEVQSRLMSFIFVVEMSSDLSPRPSRPIGVLVPLRYQLEQAQRMQNRQLALTLLGKFNQHDETMHSVLASLSLVKPVASWLFHEAVPAVVCSVSILSSIEDPIGCAQLRTVPGISQRVVHLLSWTSTLTVVSSALAVLPRLDLSELLGLGILTELLAVLRQAIDLGLDSLALMCLVDLDHFVRHCSPAVTPSSIDISLSDVISELLVVLRGLERSSRSRHLIKLILVVIRATFQYSEFSASSLSYSRQFRSLSGPALLQELLFSTDHTRRLSLQTASEQLDFILQPDCWDDLAALPQNGSPVGALRAGMSSMDVDDTHSPTRDFEMRLPKTLSGALVPASGFSRTGPKSQDLLDVVVELYQTLEEATRDLTSEGFEAVESAVEAQASDLFWASVSLIHNLNEPSLVLRSLEYLSTLSMAFLCTPSPASPRTSSPRNTTSLSLKSAYKHVKTIEAVVRRVLLYLEPSWIAPHSLSQRVPRGPVSHSPPGSDITIPCLSISAALVQHYLERGPRDQFPFDSPRSSDSALFSANHASSSSNLQSERMTADQGDEQFDHRLGFVAVVLNYCLRHLHTPVPDELELDSQLFKPLLAMCSHALILSKLSLESTMTVTMIQVPVLDIIASLVANKELDWIKLDMNLEWQILKALARSIVEEHHGTLQGSSMRVSMESSLSEPASIPERCQLLLMSLDVEAPELTIPTHPLHHWNGSLAPLKCLLSSLNPDIALLGLIGLSSFLTTLRGRKQYDSFVSSHRDLIQLASSKSVTNEMFWNRLISLGDIYPDR